jgi:hypothetical protein
MQDKSNLDLNYVTFNEIYLLNQSIAPEEPQLYKCIAALVKFDDQINIYESNLDYDEKDNIFELFSICTTKCMDVDYLKKIVIEKKN